MKLKQRIVRGPGIPTASMGDIAFLIIIFFMTTSIFSREKGLKTILPEKGQEVKIKSENILTIAVNPNGEVLIKDKIVAIPEVRAIVSDTLAKNKELVIALRVSRTAPYKTMIEVYDELKLTKAERISLIPVKEETSK
ncbi:MAG: biopolymer transporter ExbD [candidate division WOR-3 bacterium]|nr:biopolymer transporter ExbD [candidate division WOR-3 bacterium]MDH5684599.1 biopolymer transporter ExbD [candidate division WOR-3 bacterium]